MKRVVLSAIFGASLIGTGLALTGAVSAGEPLKKEELHLIIREYLLENPEIMLEMQEAFQVKQQEELLENQRKTIAENGAQIFNSSHQINFGDPNAPKTVVEFFDYNCSFCQRAMADMQRFLDADPDVRFVLKEYPVLGQQSLEATQVSLVFGKMMPEKHGEFHIALMSREGLKDREMALQVAESFGVSRDQIEPQLETSEVTEAIQEVYSLAEQLGINGTPSYVAQGEVIFGAVGYDEIKISLERQTN